MHVHFVFPRWKKLLEDRPELARDVAGHGIGTFRMASLGIPAAAAALPAGVDVTFHDENLGPVDLDVRPDLVAIGFFTPQATSAYRISDAFRERGVPSIAGGIHPTMATDDTLEHFDAVVAGEVEGLWPAILGDLSAGRLARRYELTQPPALEGLSAPRRDLFDASRYLRTGVVQVARGCGLRCRHCVVPGCYGRGVRRRPVDAVVADVRSLGYRSYYIADESFLFADRADRDHAVAVLEGLAAARLGKVFYVAAYPWMLPDLDARMLDRLRRAGCRQLYLVLGLSERLARELSPATALAVARLREAGIEVMGSFLLGHDGDDASMKGRVEEFCAAARLHLAELAITTPFPGTPEFAAMKREGRILHEDWSRYNCANVVFRPRNVSADELSTIFEELWRSLYRGVDPLEMKRRYVRAFGRDILGSSGFE